MVRMLPTEPVFTRSAVLRIFYPSQVYLLLGAAIATIGLLAAGFATLRRRFDAQLLWFSLFAILYGVRLILHHQILGPLGVHPPLFDRLVGALDYIVPIPAFLFFHSLGLLSRLGRIVMMLVTPLLAVLSIVTLMIGPHYLLYGINNVAVTVALIIFVIELLRARSPSPDITLIHRSLFVFIASALFENLSMFTGHFHNIEPFSFIILLGGLGFVAGRRTLAREHQLTEIQKELDIARRIQLSILPPPFPERGSFSVAARYLPMTTVAGDFYDFLATGDTETGLLIADVSGHGVPAALIASMVKLAAASERRHLADPALLLTEMNRSLCGNTQSQYVTAAYVYLNGATRELRYAAAAHPPMLLLRDGEISAIESNGLMLAAFDFASYSTLTHSLEPGDRIMLYTDGLMEAASATGEEFGIERLKAELHRSAPLATAAAADRIVEAVQNFSAAQNDDLTIVLCDFADA